MVNKIISAELNELKKDFPLLHQTVNDHPLVYLDSAATSQKPQVVLDAVNHYYANDNANVHRGVYTLSERATAAYEAARTTIQQFINAPHQHDIIFTKGTTEAINLVAASFGRSEVTAGDEILISAMEHHSNIVPWQILCEQTGAVLKVIPVHDDGTLDLEQYQQLLSPNTKLVALAHVSNVLGTINPVKDMIAMAHANQTPVLLDGAQAAPHIAVDVQALDCDFYAFSSHKLYGPTGFGVLYGKTQWLEKMPPYQSGGDMIRYVTFEKTEYNDLPAKFEAGTPNIAGAIGLAAAIEYVNQIGFANIVRHEQALTQYANAALQTVPGLQIIGTASEKVGVFSFVLAQAHPHDIGTILDHAGIAVRAGHHCAMPLMQRFKVPATVRASLGLYSTDQDIDRLVVGLQQVIDVFA